MTEREHLFHLHLVSDSTGETLSSISRSALAQFEGVEAIEHTWTLVRTKGQMTRVIEGIRLQPGIVMYTIVEEDLRNQLTEACQELKVPCIAVLSRIVRMLSAYLGVEVKARVGRQYALDEDYFSRIEAVNFALAHDDGQSTDNLEEADVVLVGVSRTSKTPTCVYLSYRGYYAANVPYVKNCPLPETLFQLHEPLVVGLVISPERLVQIRKSRLVNLHEERDTDYVDIEVIKEEVAEARKLFSKYKWPVIDVTRKSIEESAATIIQLFEQYKQGRAQRHRK